MFGFGKPADENSVENDVQRTAKTILGFTSFGLFALFLFTATSVSPFTWLRCIRLIGMGLLYAGACFSVGSLTGLLFGVPRTKPKEPAKTGDNGGSSKEREKEKDRRESPFATNTNLEEISDWLTKIIVGLGLVNLKLVPGYLKKVAWFFSNFCGNDVCEAVAMAVILYFSICGFFLGYLMTRLYLTGAFTRAATPETVSVGGDDEIATIPITTKPLD